MGYRKQPLGYSMQLGKIVTVPEEVELVHLIFQRYAQGTSFRELTDDLKHQDIPYQDGKTWNKCMVARILEDARYLGEGSYPALIDQELFDRVAKQRSSQQRPSSMTDAERTLKRLCQHEVTPHIVNQVLDVLNALAEAPDQIQTGKQPHKVDAILQRRELDELLVQIPVDEDRADASIRKYAVTLYDSCDSEEYETERLRRIFASVPAPLSALDDKLLCATVSSIEMNGNSVAAITLKNLQSIEVK